LRRVAVQSNLLGFALDKGWGRGIVEGRGSMSQSPNVPTSAGPRRRSQRVLMQVPVRIRGNDAQGKTFQEETATLAISAHGALILMEGRVTSGGKVFMQHNGTKQEQECHVVFLGPVRSGKAEIGLEFSESCPSFWRVAFPPEDWSPKHPEARNKISGNKK
jgi:PilZ domain